MFQIKKIKFDKFFRLFFVTCISFLMLAGVVTAVDFIVGDSVEVYNTGTSGLVVRDPNPCDSQTNGKFDGDIGLVLAGPEYCNSYNRWKIRWSDGVEGWSAEDWLKKVATQNIVITSPLEITQKDNYYKGDTVNAEFTIKNIGTSSIALDTLTVGGRFNNGELPSGGYPDFTFRRDIILNSGDSYLYQGELVLSEPGNYHFFAAYKTPDGTWNPSIDLGQGLIDEDRVEDIIVQDLPDGPYIENISPESGIPETEVIITGRNFGEFREIGSNYIKFGATLLTTQGITIDSWTDTKIIVKVPLDYGLGEKEGFITKSIIKIILKGRVPEIISRVISKIITDLLTRGVEVLSEEGIVKTDVIVHTIEGYSNKKGFTIDILEGDIITDGRLIKAKLNSPGNLQIQDSQGRITGLVNGEIKEEIPDSIYDEESESVIIFDSSDSYNYKVVGTDMGTYGLTINSVEEDETNEFNAVDIPTSDSRVHRYTIDWDALSQGEEGTTLEVDFNGDEIYEGSITSDNELTQEEYSQINFKNTGWKSPTKTGKHDDEWLNPTNAFNSNDPYATAEGRYLEQDYYNFNFNLPSNVIINGIEVSVEGHGTEESSRLMIDIWSESGSWGVKNNGAGGWWDFGYTSDIFVTGGGPTDKWGVNWIKSDFDNDRFKLRIKTFSIPWKRYVNQVLARIYYSEVECVSHSDCGTDSWIGDPICSNNNIFQNQRTYTCNNAGQTNAYCSYIDSLELIEQCEYDCLNAQCEIKIPVSNCQELQDIENNLAGSYILKKDIDCSGHNLEPIGDYKNPFTGIFDGAGFVISGLHIESDNHATGLFSYVDRAEIKNLGLGDVMITGTSAVGALVGWPSFATISNVYVSGSIYGDSMVGGLIGYMAGDTRVSDSYSTAYVSGKSEVGGLIGYVNDGIVKNCYSTGTAYASSQHQLSEGGLVGENYGEITDSYSSAITGFGTKSGGLVGENFGKVHNSYYYNHAQNADVCVGHIDSYSYVDCEITIEENIDNKEDYECTEYEED